MIEDGHATRRRVLRCQARSLERGEDVFACDLDIGSRQRRELAEGALGGAVGTGVAPRIVGGRRGLEAPGVAHHDGEQRPSCRDGIAAGTKIDESRHGGAP